MVIHTMQRLGWLLELPQKAQNPHEPGRPCALFSCGDAKSALSYLHNAWLPLVTARSKRHLRQDLDYLCRNLSPAFAPPTYKPPENPQPFRAWKGEQESSFA